MGVSTGRGRWEDRMRTAIALFISYLIAAAMTEHVSMTVAETHWTNIWTYFWIVSPAPIVFIGGFLVYAAYAFISASFTR